MMEKYNVFLTSVNDINREILLNIVEDVDLINICETNKYAAEIYKDDNFWNQRIQRIYGFDFSKYLNNASVKVTYKQIYDRLRRYNGDLELVFINSANNTYLPLVKFIIDKNVELGGQIYCTTLLHKLVCLASGLGQIDMLKYLLQDSGIDRIKNDNYIEYQALICAAMLGQMISIKYFVKELKILSTPDAEELNVAVEMGHLDVVKYLLENGPYTLVEQNSALMLAAGGRNMEIVKYLIEEIGVDPHADNGYVLVVATECNNVSTVKYLIEVARVNNIESALRMARLRGYKEMKRYLKSKIVLKTNK